MLKAIDDKPREEEWAYKQAIEELKTCDKFILAFERNGVMEHVQFRLSNVELIYYCEVIKNFALNGK